MDHFLDDYVFPCPICGKKDKVLMHPHTMKNKKSFKGNNFTVTCNRCKRKWSIVPENKDVELDRFEAIEIWNTFCTERVDKDKLKTYVQQLNHYISLQNEVDKVFESGIFGGFGL